MDKETQAFIEKWYPNYHSSDAIAYLNDAWVVQENLNSDEAKELLGVFYDKVVELVNNSTREIEREVIHSAAGHCLNSYPTSDSNSQPE